MALFFDAGQLAHFCLPTILSALVTLAPCQPGFPRSILCSTIKGCYTTLSFDLAFASLEFIVTMQASVGCAYYMQTVLLTGVAFLWVECRTFIWNCAKGSAEQIVYRKLQVLERVLNVCTRKGVFLKGALLVPTLQIILAVITIVAYHKGQNLMLVLFLALLYIVMLSFTLFLFSAAAQVYGITEQWIKRCKFGRRKGWERKFQKSLTPLRLQFGNNFVEMLTPLVVEQFCMGQTISILMMAK